MMKKTVLKGAAWLTGQQMLTFFLNLVLLVVLSRLLRPAEIGLAATLVAAMGLCAVITEFGMGAAIVQRSSITANHVRTATVYVVAAGISAVGVIWVLSPLILDRFAWFGDTRETVLLASFLALTGPALTLVSSLSQRELDFRRIAAARLSGMFIGQTLVSVALAWQGFGASSIIAGQLSSAVLQIIILTPASRLREKAEIRFAAMRDLLGFGASLSVARLAMVIHGYIDRPIIAALLGQAAVGLYVRADQISRSIDLVLQPLLSAIGFPVMARLQNNRSRLLIACQSATAASMLFVVPVSLMVSLFADDVIVVALGPGWSSTGDALKILAFVPIFMTLAEIHFALLRGTNHLHLFAALQWIVAGLIASGLYLGTSYGLAGASLGILGSRVIGALGAVLLSCRVLAVSPFVMLRYAAPWAGVAAAILLASAFDLPMPIFRLSPPVAVLMAGMLACGLMASALFILPKIFVTAELVELRHSLARSLWLRLRP
jgi:PST family polysaccharide transporter